MADNVSDLQAIFQANLDRKRDPIQAAKKAYGLDGPGWGNIADSDCNADPNG